MHIPISRLTTTLLLAAALAATGCATSKPSRFYVLASLTPPTSALSPDGPSIGVGPVVIPQYLDRPEIVTRSSGNRLDLGEFDQWGGRIGDNITRVLADNLAGLLGTERVSIYPSADGSGVADQIGVDILQFERDQSGSVTLTAFWTIRDTQSGQVLNRRSTIAKAVGATHTSGTATPYDAIVAAMSEALADLSKEIAAAVQTLPAG